MDRDEIIKLASQAIDDTRSAVSLPIPFVMRFAALVAAAERAEREKQEPVAWVHFPNKKPSIKTLSFSAEPTPQQKAVGFVSRPLYAAPPVIAPVRLTDMQVVKLFQDFNERDGASHADLIQSTEAAVLRANGFDIQPARGEG